MTLNLRLRIALAASTGLLILVVVFAATITSAVQVRQSVNSLTNLHLAAESFRSVNSGFLLLESREQAYLLTGDSSDLARYDAALKALQQGMDSLRMVQATMPADSAKFAVLDSLVSTRVSQLNAVLAAFNLHRTDGAVRQVYRSHATGTMDSLRATLRALDRAAEGGRIAVRARSTSSARNLILAEVVGGIVALVLLLSAVRQIFADLDARELVEVSLRRSERFLDSIIDLLPLMVIVKEARSLRFIRVNRTAEQLLGLPRESVLGRDDADLFPQPMAAGFATVDRAVLASDAVRDIPEEVMVAPNGAVRTLRTRKVAIHDDAGNPAYLLGVSEDITDRKRAEADILRAREMAEAANRTKSDFLAKLSHELRTPLNSIIGFAQLIEEESFGPPNDRQRRYVNNVLTSGRQLLDLINDILDLSNVEAGRTELSLVRASPLPLLQESLSRFEPLATASELRLVLDVDQGLPPVLVDVPRFQQILSSLLGNAIKYTGPGGSITLRAAVSPARSPADAPMIRITVHDTGAGFRPDDLERIFREFEQLDSDNVRSQKGTGLGLALARRLAELHGGRIWAESEFGFGASFHVELPVGPDAVVPNASVVPAGGPDARRRDVPASGRPPASLVLVVEDDPAFAELLHRYVEDCGYRVAHATSGEQVREGVSDLHPDAITLDVVLQGHDGLAVLRELKADPRTARIPVLLVSVVDDRVRGIALGSFDWLVKPMQREALVATLQRALANATESYPLVLAIDDDPGVLDVISAILEGAGVRVVTTTDPEHGLELAAAQSPAAVILDLPMSGLSGFEMVTALRAMPRMRDVPIVIISPRDIPVAERCRLEQQVLRVLAKPETAELVDELRRLGLTGTP